MNDGAAAQRGERGRYHSPRRADQALATRRAVLEAARDLFVRKGYLQTTVADIAREARVAVDTVYAAVGRKPAILREVLETAISGTDHSLRGGGPRAGHPGPRPGRARRAARLRGPGQGRSHSRRQDQGIRRRT